MITIELDVYDKKLIIISQLEEQKRIQRDIDRLDNKIWSKPDKLLKGEKQKLSRVSAFSLVKSIMP